MSLVLDASVPLEWYLGDDDMHAAHSIAERMRHETAFVTQLWPLEIANVLSLAVRKNDISQRARSAAFDTLRSMVIEIDPDTAGYAWTNTVALSDRHELTAYDAGYLELALRRALPLATLDKRLIRAARAEGIEVLP